jgi:stage III sporulation protein AE
VKMRLVFCVFAGLMILLGAQCCVRAQSVAEAIDAIDLSPLENIGDEAGLDVAALVRALADGSITLDAQTAIDAIKRMAHQWLSTAGAWMLALCLPSIALAILKRLSSDGASARAAGTVCYLAAASVVIALATQSIIRGGEAVAQMVRINEVLFPALTALLAATGKAATAAAFTPAASLFGGLYGWAINQIIFPMCGCCAALVVAGNLSDGIKLSGMTGLITSCCKWILGLCSAVLMGVLSVQGLLGSGRDGASIRTVRYAVDSLLPIIGGDVGDALELVGANAALIKSAVGVTGLLVMLSLAAGPMIELGGVMAITRLAAVVTEPIESGRTQKMMAQFSEIMGVLLAAVATAALLTILIVGAMLRIR